MTRERTDNLRDNSTKVILTWDEPDEGGDIYWSLIADGKVIYGDGWCTPKGSTCFPDLRDYFESAFADATRRESTTTKKEGGE